LNNPAEIVIAFFELVEAEFREIKVLHWFWPPLFLSWLP
jgi:hypothetical protein